MPILDFHLHVGTRHHWTPWVISFFEQNNPEYSRNFVEEITPEGVLRVSRPSRRRSGGGIGRVRTKVHRCGHQ